MKAFLRFIFSQYFCASKSGFLKRQYIAVSHATKVKIKMCIPVFTFASYKSNPSSTPQCHYGMVTGMERYPVGEYSDTPWLSGLWSAQANVEDILPKGAWDWGCL
jgi:hypothetical protein